MDDMDDEVKYSLDFLNRMKEIALIKGFLLMLEMPGTNIEPLKRLLLVLVEEGCPAIAIINTIKRLGMEGFGK